jgi:hypothetical protein
VWPRESGRSSTNPSRGDSFPSDPAADLRW